MAKVDPNIYALEIELSLNDATAIKSLKSFETSAVNVESQMSTAVNKMLTGMSSAVSGIQTSLEGVGKSLASSATEAETGFGKAAESVSDMRSMPKFINSVVSGAAKLLGLETKLGAVQKANIVALNAYADKDKKNRVEVEKSTTKKLDNYGKEVKNVTSIEKMMKTLRGSIDNKNKSHAEELKYVEQEEKALKECVDAQEDMNKSVKDGLTDIHGMQQGINAVWAALEQADKMSEQFTAQNYRAYGSQQELNNAARELMFTTGRMEDEVVPAMKAMMDIKIPKEELAEYTELTVQFSRVAQVSAAETATFVNALRAAGMNAQEIQSQLNAAAEAMSQFGLTSSDVSKVLNMTGEEAIRLKNMLGGSTEELAKFNIKTLELLGMAKSMNLSTDAVNAMQKALSDPEKLMSYAAGMGIAAKGAEGLEQVTLKATKELAVFQDQIDQANAAGDTGRAISLQNSMNQVAEAYFGSAEAGAALVKSLNAEAKATGVSNQEVTKLGKSLNISSSLAQKFGDANMTLTAQLVELKMKIEGVVGPILQFFADGVMLVLFAINKLIWAISTVIGAIVSFTSYLAGFIPYAEKIAIVFGWVKIGLQALAGIVIVYITYVVFMASVTATAGSIMSLFSGQLTFASTATGKLATSLKTIATGIGNTIAAIFRGIGQGLQAMLNAIKGNVGPMLALSVLMLSLGAAAYMVSIAMNTFSQNLVSNSIALLIFVAAFVIVILIISVLATAIMPVLPAVYALAVAFLLLGVAAFLVGFSIYLIAAGFALMAETNMAGVAAGLVLMAYALGFFMLVAIPAAIAIYFLGGASFILMALAVAFVIFGAATIIAGYGVQLVAAGLTMMAGIDILPLAIGIKTLAYALLQMVAVALPATVAISLLGLTLWWWSSTFAEAGEAFKKIGEALNQLSTAAQGGFDTIGDSVEKFATDLQAAAEKLYPAARAIKSATVMLKSAAAGLSSIGLALTLGSTSLIMGAMILSFAAGMLGAGAMILFVAAVMFVESATILLTGVIILQIAAANISTAAGMLSAAGIALSVGLLGLGAVSYLMAIIGTALIYSVFRLYLGALALAKTGFTLLRGATAVHAAASMMGNSMAILSSTTKSIGDSIFRLVLALSSLKSVQLGSLDKVVKDALGATPGIYALSASLTLASVAMEAAVNKFTAPVERLVSVLAALKEALNSLNSGITLDQDMANVGVKLEQYATLLEGASDRINTAINTTALPAMKSAENAGLKEAAMTEAVTTVQVKPNVEGDKDQDLSVTAMESQTEFYNKVLEGLDMIVNNKKVNEISTILATYLPAMAKRESGLSTEFNAWAR